MDFAQVDNGWLAFWAGLITSPHCIAMCGPLVFAVMGRRERDSEWSQAVAPLCYHGGRIISYCLVGGLIGALSVTLIEYFQLPLVRLFPWVLVALLVGFGLGVDQWIPKARWSGRLTQRLWRPLMRLPKFLASGGLGLMTPLFPCGPLYMIFWAALLSGSALTGIELALGFALGTIPLMYLAQTQFGRLNAWLSPKRIRYVQRSAALLGAVFLVWRLWSAGDTPLGADFCCPVC